MGGRMDFSFYDDFSGHYIIYSDEKIKDNYELNMIKNNKIEHLLTTTVKRMDSELEIYYNSLSMSSCSDYIKSNKIEYEHVKVFVENIKKLCESLEEYLLNINHVVIDEKLIFIDEEKRYIEFLYNPFEIGDFTEGIKQIISSILPSINHDDQATVLLTYGLMEALEEQSVTVESLCAVVKSVEEELRIKNINKAYYDDLIVDNTSQNLQSEEIEADGKKYAERRIRIKEVVTGKIEELIRKEKRTHNKKKYKERPVYQIEDMSKISGK